jgi:HAD superfamily hydrolase (TIGR01490 family)
VAATRGGRSMPTGSCGHRGRNRPSCGQVGLSWPENRHGPRRGATGAVYGTRPGGRVGSERRGVPPHPVCPTLGLQNQRSGWKSGIAVRERSPILFLVDIDVEAAADGALARPAAPVRRTAAFFDLDKTVIAKSSTLAFSRSFYQGGLINRRAVLRSAYAQFVYLVGGADHDQMERMREYLSGLVSGWDVQTVKDIVAETLHTIVDPIVYDEAVTLIDEHHLAGRDVVIVSSSGSEVVEPIGEMLGAEKVVATRMVVGEDGRFDGTIEFYAYGAAKAAAIRTLAESAGYDLARSYAYSDSATDLPMLDAVGHPYAVNPDRALRKTAAERGWPVLVFSKPVALRQRASSIRDAPKPAIAAAALGAGAAAAGLVWYASRRRARTS